MKQREEIKIKMDNISTQLELTSIDIKRIDRLVIDTESYADNASSEAENANNGVSDLQGSVGDIQSAVDDLSYEISRLRSSLNY